MQRKNSFFVFSLLSLLLLLGGCATNPYSGDEKVLSDTRLQQQFAQASQAVQAKPQGKVIFAGFALHSQSKAFRADVESAEKLALAIDPDAVIFRLVNPALGNDAGWPNATAENVATVLGKVAELARPQDKIIVLMSTHGAPNLLAINFANTPHPNIDSRFLKKALQPLQGKAVLLVLSACYSGSFIEPLASPNHIVVTAAAKDRASFGCQFQSTNTYFADAFFNQPAASDKSINDLMTQARLAVDKKEKAQKLSPPSLPQISVGSAAKAWADQPLKSWLGGK
jgi:Peptidase C13 family